MGGESYKCIPPRAPSPNNTRVGRALYGDLKFDPQQGRDLFGFFSSPVGPLCCVLRNQTHTL